MGRQAWFLDRLWSSYLYISSKKNDYDRFYIFLKDLRIFDPSKFFLVTRFSVPWCQRLSFILYWQIVRRESLLKLFLLARSAESREKEASGRDRWEPHFHAISF